MIALPEMFLIAAGQRSRFGDCRRYDGFKDHRIVNAEEVIATVAAASFEYVLTESRSVLERTVTVRKRIA
jgi:hypothetical protein